MNLSDMILLNFLALIRISATVNAQKVNAQILEVALQKITMNYQIYPE